MLYIVIRKMSEIGVVSIKLFESSANIKFVPEKCPFGHQKICSVHKIFFESKYIQKCSSVRKILFAVHKGSIYVKERIFYREMMWCSCSQSKVCCALHKTVRFYENINHCPVHKTTIILYKINLISGKTSAGS